MRLTLSRAGSGAPAAAAAASAAVAWPPRGLGTPPKAPAAPRLSLHRWKHLRVITAAATAAAGAVPRGFGTSAAGPSLLSLSPSDDVEVAVHAVLKELNRQPGPAEAALVGRLREEWYDTAASLADLDDAMAAKLGVPLRLRSKLTQMLQHGSGGAEGAAAAPAAAAGALRQPGPKLAGGLSLPSQALDLVSGLFNLRGRNGNVLSTESATASASSSWDMEVEEQAARFQQESTSSSSSSGGGGSTWDYVEQELALPIEQRRCPPLGRFGHRCEELPQVTRRVRAEAYALKDSEMSEALRQEFAALHTFLTQRFFGQQAEPIQPVTASKYADHLRGFLGYLHRERGVPMDALSLRAALPSHRREGVALLFDYVTWLQTIRSIGIRTEGLVLRAASAAAKYLYHEESRVDLHSGEKPYSDLQIIKELRRMNNDTRKAGRVAARVSDESLKWLDWPEFLQVAQELRRECAALNSRGKPRSRKAVAASLQKYLIFGIFSCVPDRQRTLRELEVGRTLVRAGDRWVIKHSAGDYKTGRAYGERPPLVLAPHLYPELEAFMATWRQELQPKHSLLFTSESGEPLTDKSLYKLFWTTAFRITGKKTNPHLVRDSIVTYLRGGGASERELEALAIYMGHSVEMQRDVYDRRTVAEKVEPAVELLSSINAAAATGGRGQSSAPPNRPPTPAAGATGFTGRLVAEHLSRDYKGDVRWALAGRNREKLEALRLELSKALEAPELNDVPILLGDLSDQSSLDAIASSTRVVLSTAGPFLKIGAPLVDAAVRGGAHYVDITGEVLFVKTMIEKHHDEAARKGLRIVPCCGYDSTPFDMGALLVVDHIERVLGKQAGKVVGVVLSSKGGVSGGTLASGMNLAEERGKNPEAVEAASGVYALVPPEAKGKDQDSWGVEWNPDLHRWLAPFVMQVTNSRVVARSNYFLKYGPAFSYEEHIAAGSWLAARTIQLGTLAAMGLLSSTWAHPLLKRLLPAPGEGPSRETMMSGHFRHAVLGYTVEPAGKPPTVVRAEVGDPNRDGGYWGTARMLLEAALCLALQQQDLDADPRCIKGGVLTPASALGATYLDRLRKARLSFEIKGEEPAAS